MKKLIKINTDNKGTHVVSASELYAFLGHDKTHWKRWYTKNIEKNPFAFEKQDWEGFALMANGNPTKDFALTLDFAKRLAMMARTEQGEKIRKYFIKCEEDLLRIKQCAMFNSQIDYSKVILLSTPPGPYNHLNYIGDYDEYDTDIHVRRFIKENINRWLTLEFIPDSAFFNEYKAYCKANGIAKPLQNVLVNHVIINYCPKIGIKVNHSTLRAGHRGKTFNLNQ